jgi:rhodanese-related sulfurtransferase
MKTIKLFVITILTIGFVACKKEVKKEVPKETETVDSKSIGIITTDELKSFSNSIQLVDVRTPDEYASGYIKNAINIDLKGNDFIEGMVLFNKSKPVYVYCVKGVRSQKAAEALLDAGFSQVYNYKGGFGEWTKGGNTISVD